MNDYTDPAERNWRRLDRDERRREQRDLRRAYRRAEVRAELIDELIKYVLVVALLLIFLRPIGVIVGIVWGLKLYRRFSRLSVYPDLRRRWVDRELERRAPRFDPEYRAAIEELDTI